MALEKMFKTMLNSLKNRSIFMMLVATGMSLLYGAELKFEEVAPSYIEIKAIIWNKRSRDESLEYILEVKKAGKSISKQIQKGKVFVPSGERITDFSRIRIKIDKGESLKARLLVYKNGKVVADVSSEYPHQNLFF